MCDYVSRSTLPVPVPVPGMLPNEHHASVQPCQSFHSTEEQVGIQSATGTVVTKQQPPRMPVVVILPIPGTWHY